MQSIVITGASGFLGRAVTTRLASLGFAFTAVSRRCAPGFYNVADYIDTPAGDVLIHLAEEPDRAKVNALGADYFDHSALVVDTLSRRASTIIYVSSGVVYGDANDKPFDTAAVVTPTDGYSRSKVRNEAIALSAGGTVLRLSNLFGFGMSPHNVINDIARQLCRYGPLKVRDDRPVRDFLSANAAADAIALLVKKPVPGILNIGSGVGTSIRELALLALRVVGQEDREIAVTHPASRHSVNILDITETQRLLGWSPNISPADTLENLFLNGVNFENQKA
jgi:UDP-glucose 4-epimerase